MADIESALISETAASNNAAPPNGAPEGMAPSAVNDTMREHLAQGKREWNRSHTTIATAGTATAYTATYTTAPAAYVHGQRFAAKIHADSGADATLNVNALGAKTIKKMTSAGLANLLAADLKLDHHAWFEYDSVADAMVLMTPNAVGAFPAGTKMLFQQTAAPTGWTKDTTHNDKALRVVSGTVGSGGTAAFSSVFASGLTTGGTALTIAQMPLHGHPWRHTTADAGFTGSGGGLADSTNTTLSTISAFTGAPSNAAGQQIGGEGGGAAHTHTLGLDLMFVDLIIATKD